MPQHKLTIIIACILTIHLIINLLMYWKHSSLFVVQRRSLRKLIHSGVIINSFNPSRLHLILDSHLTRSNIVSISDNDVFVTHFAKISKNSSIPLTLPDGFHHMDILIVDKIQNVEFYQEIDFCTGSQSLLVVVLDKRRKAIRDIFVHLELIDHPHINIKHRTNQFGQVRFHHLPKHIKVYIEAVSLKSKRHTSIMIDTLNYHNITLVLEEMSALHFTEYDLSEQGFYAV